MSILSRTLLVAVSMSMPLSNSKESTEVFSREVEERCFRSGTAFSVFSKVLEMLVSISAALAPG